MHPSAAPQPQNARAISSSFIQPYNGPDWSALDDEFAQLRIQKLLFQFVTDAAGNRLDQEIGTAILQMRRVKRFTIGLHYDGHFPNADLSEPNPFRAFETRTRHSAELIKVWADDPRVGGAYIAGEIHNDPLDDTDAQFRHRQGLIRETLARLAMFIRGAGFNEIAISGFANYRPPRLIDPKQAADVFTNILRGSGITRFYFQTGCGTVLNGDHPGTVKLPIEQLARYVTTLARAFELPGMPELVIDVELYEPSALPYERKPASHAFVQRQLASIRSGLPIAAFAAPHYMTKQAALVPPWCGPSDAPECKETQKMHASLAAKLYADYREWVSGEP